MNGDELTPERLKHIEAQWKSDMDLKVDRIDERVKVIERLVWVGVGGTAIIGAITFVGVGIVIKQGDKLDAVALRQAGVIGQADSIHKHHQDQIDRLRNGEKR